LDNHIQEVSPSLKVEELIVMGTFLAIIVLAFAMLVLINFYNWLPFEPVYKIQLTRGTIINEEAASSYSTKGKF
jgi:hypothetical protein